MIMTHKFLFQNLFGRNYRLNRLMQQVSNDINNELAMRMRYTKQAGAELSDAWDYTKESVTGRLQPLISDMNQAYRRNEFYMKDICEAGQSVYQDVRYTSIGFEITLTSPSSLIYLNIYLLHLKCNS